MRKVTIPIALIAIVAVIYFIVNDFYNQKHKVENPYVYNIEKLKRIDSTLVKYKEQYSFTPKLINIKALAIDNEDKVYVSGDDGVAIFENDGKFISRFNTPEKANCIAVDNSRNVIIGMKNHIEIYGQNGNLISKWKTISEKTIITSIAINKRDIFVADAGNRIVYRYNKSGRLLNTIGKKDESKGIKGFIIPSPYFDLAIGRNEELWVVNPGLHTLMAFKPEGDLITPWKKSSMGVDGFNGCCNPSHIAMLSNGSFVTSEKGIERVKIHNQTGEFECAVASPENFVSGSRGMDLAVDSQDNIFVLDPENNKIRIFVRI